MDDPLDAFAVHGGCGLWGLIAAALFANPMYVGSIGLPSPGAFYGDATLLAATVVGSLAIVAWVSTSTSLLFLLLQRLGLLRVDVQSELVGLDCIEHDGPPPSPPRSPHRLGLTPLALSEERVHAGGHAGGWRAAGQLAAVEEPPPPGRYPTSTSIPGRYTSSSTSPANASPARLNGRHRGTVSSHRVVDKAASVHGGESWRPHPANGGGIQPRSLGSGLRRVSSTGAVHMPVSPGAAARAAAAAGPCGGYALMEEQGTQGRGGRNGGSISQAGGVQLPMLRRVGSGSGALSALAARCRATIGHAATVHGASNFEV